MTYLMDAIVDLIFMFARAVISLLPTYDPGYHDALRNAGTALRTFNQYFPIQEMMYMITLWLTLYTLVMIIRPLMSFVNLR